MLLKLNVLCVQMFGFLLYVSEYAAKADGSILSIPKVQPSLKFILKLINLTFALLLYNQTIILCDESSSIIFWILEIRI